MRKNVPTLALAKHIFVTLLMTSVIQAQVWQSPCPRTFEYAADDYGEIYGSVGVYSFDENLVQLNVELSVGNTVDNYNGRIDLATPKQQVLRQIQQQQPIMYKVSFPRWENTPPRVTKILVNGQKVCSGPPLPRDGGYRIITTVNLQHRFTIQIGPLRSNSFSPSNSVVFTKKNPFLQQIGRVHFNQANQPSFEANPEQPQNPFLTGNNPEVYNFDTTLTTVKPSTFKKENTATVNDLLFDENPFLNGKGSFTQNTPSRVSPIPEQSTSSICGAPVIPNHLVVNGETVVVPGAFPWLAAIFVSTGSGMEYQCCGSLVSNKHVITAAHCLEKNRTRISPDKFIFVFGKLNIATLLTSDDEKIVGAADFRIHPDYIHFSSDADIAVVVLSQELRYSKYIRPICLWSESYDENRIGEAGKVVGWGRDEENRNVSPQAREVTLPIVGDEQCLRSSAAFKDFTSNRTFCAGERNGKGPCNGDSGSGFIVKRNGRWTLKGIVSISIYDPIKSCDLSNYVVFTDVTKFRTWLLTIISL